MNRMAKGYAMIIISGVIFGFLPLGTLFAYECGMTTATLVFFRNILTGIALAVLLKARGLSIAPDHRVSFVKCALLGVFCGITTPLLLFASYSYIPSGTATTFHYVYPAATIIGGAIFLHVRPRRGHIAALALCTAGIITFHDPSSHLDLFGSAIAILSGFTYATYIVLLDGLKTDEPTMRITMLMSIFCAPPMLIYAHATGALELPPTAAAMAITAALAIGAGLIGQLLFQSGTRIIGGLRASILSTFEPLTSIFAGIVFLGEAMTLRSAIGTVLVLSAAALVAITDARAKA